MGSGAAGEGALILRTLVLDIKNYKKFNLVKLNVNSYSPQPDHLTLAKYPYTNRFYRLISFMQLENLEN